MRRGGSEYAVTAFFMFFLLEGSPHECNGHSRYLKLIIAIAMPVSDYKI